jgi:hypothetical protein
MRKFERLWALLAVAGFVFGIIGATPAAAQATRTWVSGVGDDVNPCSRTAPCKTFAGAISKTAAGGEINCLDPAGFGAVTITKSIIIDCHFTEGGVLAGGNAIVVNAGASDVVVLRGLDILGVNPPTNGIRFIAGGALHVEDCVIRRFNAANSFGISFQPSATSRLYLRNVVISENGNGATGGGILVQPTGAGGSARFQMNNVALQNNANIALSVNTTGNTSPAGVIGMIEGSQVATSTTGIQLLTPVGASGARVMVDDVTLSENGTGLIANGGSANLIVNNSVITSNTLGVSRLSGGVINTFGNNQVVGNDTAGTFTTPNLTPS